MNELDEIDYAEMLEKNWNDFFNVSHVTKKDPELYDWNDRYSREYRDHMRNGD